MRTVFPVISIILLFTFLVIERQAFASFLPLASSNEWFYEFKDQSPGITPVVTNEKLELGVLENLGDFCMSPLVFGDEQLSLFLLNLNEQLVLYGFRGLINGREIEFFFHSGDRSSVYSGIPLAGMDELVLLQNQKGRQIREVNEQKITIDWEVRNKTITNELLTESYVGLVNSVSVPPINTGELYTVEFYLYLGPCQIEGGCNAGIFKFTFLDGLGLTEVHLRGDHPEFGGQFDHIFSLLVYPDDAFDLESNENLVEYTSCQTKNRDDLQRAQLGNITNWFNILLLLVVVLRCFHAPISACIGLPKSKVNR